MFKYISIFLILFTSIVLSQSELSDRYTTLEEIENQLNAWHEEFGSNQDPYTFYPGNEGIIYHHEIIGYSGVDNLPIWAVKLTLNADLNEDKPKALILGQCHAEEIYGVEIAMDLIKWMLYPMDHPAQIQSILSIMTNAEIWIIPTHNPEGLSVVHGWYDDLNQFNQDVYYRKNKYDANNNGIFDFVIGIGNDYDGVDLNRNYDFNWIFGDAVYSTDSGCGANPSYIANYDYYRGPAPFSESEVVAIRDFVLSKNFLLSIAYHSSRSGCVAEKVIYPWEWDVNKKSPDFDIISRLGFEMSQLLPKEAESGFYASASSISRRGNAHDWIYANTGCIQYLVEVGTENMQSDNVDVINETVEKNVISALHMLKRTAGTNIQNGPERYQITGLITDSQTGEPLQAEVWIDELTGPMLKPRYSDEFGRYRRLLIEGTYNINFKLFGYETQTHTFVPSSSQITEFNVSLEPLDYFDLEIDLSLPNIFDENLYTVIQSDTFQDTIMNETNLQLSLPLDSYKIMVYSENLYPESFDVQLNSNTDINKDLRWKSAVFYDDFSTLDAWANEGWNLSGGTVSTQSNFLYLNDLNIHLTSFESFEPNNYVLDINLRREIEWDNDFLNIGFSTSNNDFSGQILSDHDYDWNDLLIPITLENSGNLYFNFVTDNSLDYRGVDVNHLVVYEKPDSDCDKGDLNLDALINILDITYLVDLIVTGSPSAFEECVADSDDDGIVNVIDIIDILNLILEIN